MMKPSEVPAEVAIKSPSTGNLSSETPCLASACVTSPVYPYFVHAYPYISIWIAIPRRKGAYHRAC